LLSDLLDQIGLTMSNAVWGVAILVALFVISIAVVVLIVVLMPADYFLDKKSAAEPPKGYAALRWSVLVLKNLLGAALVVVGGVMLVSPGQGVLTLLIGVMLLDFPGKRRLEQKLVGQPRVLASINRLRGYFHKSPLRLEDKPPAAERIGNESAKPPSEH